MSATNILTASLIRGCGKIIDADEGASQWDKGLVLKLRPCGFSLPVSYVVEFSTRSKAGDAIPQLGSSAGVSIPDELLEEGKDIFAFVVLQTGQDDRETAYTVRIRIQQRPKPADYEPTPAQQSALEQAVALLNDAAERLATAEAAIPDQISAALADAKASGEFRGTQIWRTDYLIGADPDEYDGLTPRRKMTGNDGFSPAVGDYLLGPAIGNHGTPTDVYVIAVVATVCQLTWVCSIGGAVEGDAQ